MDARDVIARVVADGEWVFPLDYADAILAALSSEGWRVVRLDERSPYYRPTIPSDEPLYVITKEATP